MAADNHVSITGNVTRDPELRFTQAGKAVASFGVALNTGRMVDGKWDDGDPMFFDVTAWESLGENIAESVTKGQRVTVTGRLRYRTWETDDGEKRSKVEIVADDVAPSLRWATAEVTKNAKNGKHSDLTPPDDDEEPF